MNKVERLGIGVGGTLASFLLAGCGSGLIPGNSRPEENQSSADNGPAFVMTYVFKTSPEKPKSSNRTCAFIDTPDGTFKECMTAGSIADFTSNHDQNWYGGDFTAVGSVLMSACYYDETGNAVLMTAKSDDMWDISDAYKRDKDLINQHLVRDANVVGGDTPCVRQFKATDDLFYIVADSNRETSLAKPEFVPTEDWPSSH